MIYLVLILLIVVLGLQWWGFTVLHNMIQGLYKKEEE